MKKMIRAAVASILVLCSLVAVAMAATEQQAEEMGNLAAQEQGDALIAEAGAEERCANQSPPVDPETVQNYQVGQDKMDDAAADFIGGVASYLLGDWTAAYNLYASAVDNYWDAQTAFDAVYPGMM